MKGESLLAPEPPSTPSPASLLASAEVRSAIVATLHRHRVQFAEVEDLTQQVLARAFALEDPPTTLPACVALAQKMTRAIAIDTIRQRRSRRPYDAGVYENPDDVAAPSTGFVDIEERIDILRQLEFARRQLEAGVITPRQATIFESEADDVPQLEIAKRLKISFQTVRNDLARGRRAMRESWVAYATMAIFAVIGLLAALRERTRPNLEATDVPDLDLDHSVAPPEPTPEEEADAIRRYALRACSVHQWDECLEGLDRAARLDPAGDTKPWVQKAKLEAIGHMDDKLP